MSKAWNATKSEAIYVFREEEKKKKSQEQRNQKDSRRCSGSPSEFRCLLDMVMRAWSVQVLVGMDYVVINSNNPSISRHKQVTS